MSDVDHSQEITLCLYYRDAELHGARLLFHLLRRFDDPEAQELLTEHVADETRHAWLWTERALELGGQVAPVFDGYQIRIGKRVGVVRDLVDLLALTTIVEQRSLRRYADHLGRRGVPERTRAILREVVHDEGWHIEWVRRKGRALDVERFDLALARFAVVDATVTAELAEREQALMKPLA
jgi:bacterioferritin (cytochrome b1)